MQEKIVKIEKMGKRQTYDFQVAGTNSFVANDIVVHNSGVIEENCHAVIIVHWYWKSMMKQKDGSEYGGNDYAVYIAKNRGGRTGLKNVLFYPQYYNFENKDNETAEEIFGGNNANRTGTKDFYTQNKGSIEDRFCKPSGDTKGQGSIGEGLS